MPVAMAKIEKLIALVKEKSFLFDVSDARYKDRKLKRHTWEEIAREMGTHDANAWYNRWKGLRDNYSKFKKYAESPSGVYKKYKKWPWAKLMAFLDDYNNRVTKKLCNHKSDQNADISNDQLFLTENLNGEELNDPVPECLENFISDSDIKNELAVPNETQEHHQLKTSDQTFQLDGIDHFFLSYAQSFKNLPTKMQIMLKLEIATLFSRYELQAEGVSSESINNMTRIVPEPVKTECFLFNTMEED